ncbi:MAG: sugar phosphate isomerase/epimerase [Planctomycetaceae bacterium]|nr:sugar phosphate isomerase/epimerase [Planctomycetaceae bacterium]MCB9952348.1 sugar phosphate isomerase/epimerase [Planctomycetaceae bacterium]
MPAFSSRRFFLKSALAAGCALAVPPLFAAEEAPIFRISLAQWSLHRELKGGKLDNLDFAKVAKEEFGIDAIEYVNQFFKDKAKDEGYLGQMKQRAADLGVKSVLIMVDGEGALGDADTKKRAQTVDNHKKWVEAAAFLGCHAVRVNAQSSGSFEEQIERAADGLRQLTEFAEGHNLSVIVENHGGLSSNGTWLSSVMQKVDHPHCGTLPDFGNFRIQGDEWYDRYKGVEELMPFAHAVSAKSHDFDDNGNETRTDYTRMMKIVLDAGYRGYVGIEYEGSQIPEREGIQKTKALLERVRTELTPAYS